MLERTDVYFEESTIMPTINMMMEKLNATSLPLRHQGVLFRFVNSIAEQEETGSTLVAAWQGACQDGTRTFRFAKDKALISLLHKYSFPGVIDAIVLDQEVATDAKDELRSLTEKILVP